MEKQVRVHRLLSVLFVLSLVVTCFVCTDTSSADDTVLASIDPVEFGDTGAEAAANKINTAAGESVCVYHNGTLTFTKSVTITSKNKLSDQNLITFSSIAEQKIEINEGVKVELLYDVASVGTNYCGAIYAAHNLTIGGSGDLVIQVKADSYSDRLCGIVAKGQFTVKNNSLSIGAANSASVNHFAGIYYTSNCICFNGLNCSINAHDYAIYLAGTGDVIFESHYCTAKYIGNQKAIHSVSGKLDIDYKGTEIQASNYITGQDPFKINASQITQYKYVYMITSEDQRNTDNLNAILTFVGSATILAVVIIAVSRWQKRRGDSKYRYSNVNVKVTKSVQMTKHESIDDITRISDGSEYHQLTAVSYAGYCSFTLIVDGKVCGFIRPNPAEIRVPNGEHDISITTNDVNNKTVYHNRMNLDGVRIMTIKSSGKKYLVEWK